MTLTRPVLDAARLRVWLVTGPDKAPAVERLLAGDPDQVAARIRPSRVDGHPRPGSRRPLTRSPTQHEEGGRSRQARWRYAVAAARPARRPKKVPSPREIPLA